MTVSAATKLTAVLKNSNQKIVLAESCTGGRAAALLTLEPGVSAVFCGSAVTYQEATKSAWLGISPDLILTHTAESPETTLAMAIGVLQRTPNADWSAAVTGHLGPGAPGEKDGIIFVATARRIPSTRPQTVWQMVKLTSKSRADRQREAAEHVLAFLLKEVLAVK